MLYDSKQDFLWLCIRPWVWIPRMLEIAFTIIFFIVKLLFQITNTKTGYQEILAKDLLKRITYLGPCFIKVGQALSTRPDLISKHWLNELTKLQDRLPAFEHTLVIDIIKEELGHAPDEIFKEFPKDPIASASLGIVYKALLYEDSWVAVKVQRPNLDFIIRRDLVLIRIISLFIGPFLPLNLGFNLGEIIDEFGISLFNEIDYKKEADNAQRFGSLFKNNASVYVPIVNRDLSSQKVITTSWVDGIKIENKRALENNGIDPTSIVRIAVISGIQQLLEFGYFHADPHPGNLFALRGKKGNVGELAYIDFGMMDSISDKDRLTLTGAIVHLINKDYALLSKDFQSLGFLNKEENLSLITPVIKSVFGDVLTKEVGSFNLKSVTDKFSELMFNYPFRVPSRFALIIRAVVSQEGLALKLDPSFKILHFAYPYIAKRLLIDQSDQMVDILSDVMFDKNNRLQVERIEGLLDILVQESDRPSKQLLPVARDSIKLLVSSRGISIRKKLLLSLIKNDKFNTSEIKILIKIINNKLKLSSTTKRFY